VTLTWKSGFEIELLAPPGASRADLATRVAARVGGSVRRFFHPQSEPSAVPGTPVFENLTLGFEVIDAAGARVAAFVDDLTLQADLEKRAAPKDGWYRVVADDARLLRLAMRHCDAAAPLASVLDPLAALFGTDAAAQPETQMVRVTDDRGVSVAIAAPLPGERERPCEIVTAPIAHGHAAVLEALLDDAIAEGFSVPQEGATHIHFDAAPLLNAPTIAALVETLWRFGDDLKSLVGANPACVRLGRWPEALLTLVREPRFTGAEWPAAREMLAGAGLTKYCDFNLFNIATEMPGKHTFEVRIFPVWLEVEPLLDAAALFEALLRRCCDAPDAPLPDNVAALIDVLPLDGDVAARWREKLRETLPV
jgi:hypothetical protein